MRIRSNLYDSYVALMMSIWLNFEESFDELGPRKAQYGFQYQLALGQFLKYLLEGEGVSCSDDNDEIRERFSQSGVYSRLQSITDLIVEPEGLKKVATEYASKATDDEFAFCTSKLLRLHVACRMLESMIPGFKHHDNQREVCSYMDMYRHSMR